MKDAPVITINMDRKCRSCGKKGAADGGLCLKCTVSFMIARLKKEAANMKNEQPKLIPVSAEEIATLKDKLSSMVGEYLQLEEEKKAADQDWNERMSELWDEIKLQRAKIEAAE